MLKREIEEELKKCWCVRFGAWRLLIFSLLVNPTMHGIMTVQKTGLIFILLRSARDVKTAFSKMHEVSSISAFTAESENTAKTMATEIKELKQTVVRLQQDAQAYKKANEVLTERLNEYEARLRDHGEVLRKIPTMQKQIAYLKGIIERHNRKKAKN